MQITTLGIDLAKSVFQLHGIDDAGSVLLRKKVRRQALLDYLARMPPCLIGMEACATAHFWAREIAALGHEVRLIPPAYVKPYVKRQKNDMADAEAICEAVLRPNMHFVAIKSAEQQAVLMLHRSRELLVRHRIAMINALRAHLAEFGIVAARGAHKMRELVAELQSEETDIPAVGRTALLALVRQLDALEAEIAALDREIHAWHRQSEISCRLATIPGVGVITATAAAATVTDAGLFASARQFAAWLGLVPRQTSSGGKDRLGRITKMGDGYLRKLLVIGATSIIRSAGRADPRTREWVQGLLERKPARLASVAMANKMARVIWALIARGESYRTA